MSGIGAQIAAAIADGDRLLSPCVVATPTLGDGQPARAAEGPRATSDPDSYRYALEAILEGHLLHGGQGRLIDTDDLDLALLAGDRLYAEGLIRMAELGDTFAISELSRLIVACAVARAAGDADAMASAWAESCARIGGIE